MLDEVTRAVQTEIIQLIIKFVLVNALSAAAAEQPAVDSLLKPSELRLFSPVHPPGLPSTLQ